MTDAYIAWRAVLLDSEGFSHFVTSMTAPIASGRSGCRVGLAPAGKRRLITAHTQNRHHADRCARLLELGPLLNQIHDTATSKPDSLTDALRCRG